MPRGLFGRSLIIIVTPVVILQGIVTYVFFERHYDVMLARMGRGAAADVVFLTNLEEKYPACRERKALLDMAARSLGFGISVVPVRTIAMGVYTRAMMFLKRAGTTIFSMMVLIWFLASFPRPPEGATGPAIDYSLAAIIGKWLEPLLRRSASTGRSTSR